MIIKWTIKKTKHAGALQQFVTNKLIKGILINNLMAVVNEINFLRETTWSSGRNGSFFAILRISCAKFHIFIGGGGCSNPQKNVYLLKFLCKPSKRRLDGQKTTHRIRIKILNIILMAKRYLSIKKKSKNLVLKLFVNEISLFNLQQPHQLNFSLKIESWPCVSQEGYRER